MEVIILNLFLSLIFAFASGRYSERTNESISDLPTVGFMVLSIVNLIVALIQIEFLYSHSNL